MGEGEVQVALAEETHLRGCGCPACAATGDTQDAALTQGANIDGTGGFVLGKPVWSVEQIALHLNRNGGGWGDTGNMFRPRDGDASVINFGFYTSQAEVDANGYTFLNGGAPFTERTFWQEFSAAQKDAARETMQTWDDLIPVSFRETSALEGDINFANYTDQPGTQAYAYLPTGTIGTQSYREVAGDVWVQPTSVSNLRLDEGQYGMQTLVHEVGHALGLSHPGAYNAAPGLALSHGVNAEYAQDTRAYATMSYYEANVLSARHYDFNTLQFAYAGTPLIHDIAAIQAVYGADPTTRTGDTTYGFNSNADRDSFDFVKTPAPITAIYDAGGIDTLDASGYHTTQLIDLTPGSMSSIGGWTYETAPTFAQMQVTRAAAGYTTPGSQSIYDSNMAALRQDPTVGLLTDNVGIAYGTIIENAIGGHGADTMIGNAVANVLTGNAGDDVLEGRGGDDTLNGGAGQDVASFATATGGVNIDLNAGSTFTTSLGTDTFNSIEGVIGSAHADVLTGDAQNNLFAGGLGDDTLVGGEGTDTVSFAGGPAVTFSLAVTTAQATGQGTDTISGFENVTGSSFADRLTGTDDANLIDGGLNADTMTGGRGDDRYVVSGAGDVILEEANEGVDTVLAFSSYTLSANVENLELTGTAINATGNALNNVLKGNGNNNVLVGAGGDDLIDGGDGVDTASFAGSAIGVVASLVTGTATGEGSDTLISIENLTGSASADVLTGDAGNNVIVGGAGSDILAGGDGVDTLSFAGGAAVVASLAAGTATSGADVDVISGFENLTGSGGNDRLTGDDLANILDGGAGVDTLAGGLGDDRYFVDSSSDVATEGVDAGFDTVVSTANYALAENI